MSPVDYPTIHPILMVAKHAIEAAGFKVDFQVMDWGTLVSRRAKKEGWDIFSTWWVYFSAYDPVIAGFLSPGWFGWYTSPRMEELRAKFAKALMVEEKRRIVDQVQLLYYEEVPVVHPGQFFMPHAGRTWVKGYEPKLHYPVFWNVWIEK
jgi:peptide/nickel transport system substrate-binding protein